MKRQTCHALPARLEVFICSRTVKANVVRVPYFVQSETMAAEQGELEQQLEQHEAQPGTAGNDEVADAQAVAACPPSAPEHAAFAQECQSLTQAIRGSTLVPASQRFRWVTCRRLPGRGLSLKKEKRALNPTEKANRAGPAAGLGVGGDEGAAGADGG